VTAALGRVRASCRPALRLVCEVLPLDWDRRARITPAQTTSQEAWPGPEPWGLAVPLARAAVERRQANAPQGASRNASCGGYGSASCGVPLSFFRFLHLWLKALIVTMPAPPPASSDEDRGGERNFPTLEQQLGCGCIARTGSLNPPLQGEGQRTAGAQGGEVHARRGLKDCPFLLHVVQRPPPCRGRRIAGRDGS